MVRKFAQEVQKGIEKKKSVSVTEIANARARKNESLKTGTKEEILHDIENVKKLLNDPVNAEKKEFFEKWLGQRWEMELKLAEKREIPQEKRWS